MSSIENHESVYLTTNVNIACSRFRMGPNKVLWCTAWTSQHESTCRYHHRVRNKKDMLSLMS